VCHQLRWSISLRPHAGGSDCPGFGGRGYVRRGQVLGHGEAPDGHGQDHPVEGQGEGPGRHSGGQEAHQRDPRRLRRAGPGGAGTLRGGGRGQEASPGLEEGGGRGRAGRECGPGSEGPAGSADGRKHRFGQAAD